MFKIIPRINFIRVLLSTKPCKLQNDTYPAAPMFANDPRRNSFEEPAPVTETPLENNCVTVEEWIHSVSRKREYMYNCRVGIPVHCLAVYVCV